MARTEWLSQGAERLAAELLAGPGPHCDVAIVGSGYGGAVAAARLAGAIESDGRRSRVWLLERGREYLTGSFPERFADLPGHVRITAGEAADARGLQEGLFDVRLGEHVSALLGNGLGGGSLINAGVLARPLQSVFRRRPWPWQFADDALEPHFCRVEATLAQSRIPAPGPDKLRSLEWLGRGIDGSNADRRAEVAVKFRGGTRRNRFGVPQADCIGCGDCFTGCNHGAKNTLATNYLPLAFRRGARLFTGVTVLSLGRAGEHWALQLQFTDAQIGRRFDVRIGTLFARRVILAAGTYGSTAILLRSQANGFSELSAPRLGRRFSTNGDMIALATRMSEPVRASAHEAQAPGARGIGPTICGLVDRRWGATPIAIEELAIPAALRRPFEEIVASLSTLHGLGRIDWSWHRRHGQGGDPAGIQGAAIDRTAVYATMGDDGAAGEMALIRHDRSLTSDAGVRIAWPHVAEHPVFREAIAILERAHGPFGATVIPNPMWRALPESLGGVLEGGGFGGSVFTVHPLGGCAMAERAEEGVVNRFGQVFRGDHGDAVHESLAVLDGAIVPSALGINPCLTIAALAEYGVQGLAQAWNLALSPQAQMERRLPPPPRRHREKSHVAPRPTALRIAERLNCREVLLPVRLAEGGIAMSTFQAALELRYEALADLETFLSRTPKLMQIPDARLTLEGRLPAGALLGGGALWAETLELRGQLRLFERESSTVLCRIWRAGRAWWRNRGRVETYRMIRRWLRGESPPGRPNILKALYGWLAVASHAGEARRMRYELEVLSGRLLGAGERLVGEKRIAYVIADPHDDVAWPTPWDQLTKLPVSLAVPGGAGPVIGVFEVDLPYFVQHHAAQLQVTAQQNQPRAIAGLLSFFAYLVRLVGKIHIWSLRAPDYPDPYPLYEFPDDFNVKEREEAHTAARAAGVRTEDRLAHRLPRRIPGLRRSVVRVSPREPGREFPEAAAPDPPQQRLAPEIRLTRYRRRGSANPPVLLIHGLGAGGNTFTLPTIPVNLVRYLVEEGFEPWVLDLRTSIGLACSKRDWSFDDVARSDIPAAVDLVRQWTRREEIDVVAHCIGSATFCMSALGGHLRDVEPDPANRLYALARSYGRVHVLQDGRIRAGRRHPRNWIRTAVLSQVGPLLALPPTNRFRGYLASYFKHYLQIGEFDTTGSLIAFNRFLDRVLGTYPYPRSEWHVHRARRWDEPVTHEAFCLRTYGIYGRLFEHSKLNGETLERLGDYLGHIRYRTYQQTIFYATMRRLTDEQGRNVFVRDERIRDHMSFPVCFLHGSRNEVFDRETSRRSFDLLASVLWPEDLARLWRQRPERRSGYTLFARGRHLRLHELRTYGHQDTMIGRHAHIDVFPRITQFLNEAAPARLTARQAFVIRAPRLGPILGWIRIPAGGHLPQARILFAPNESRSLPLYAMSIVLRDGQPVPGYARFHRLAAEFSDPGAPTQAIDVPLPGFGADHRVAVVTVHREHYEQDPGRQEARDDDFIGEGRDRFPILPPDVHFPGSAQDAVRMRGRKVSRLAASVLQTLPDLDLQGEPLQTEPRACDRRYALPVSTAVLDRDVVAPAARGSRTLCFALASCRFAATAVDRELADASFGRLRARLGPEAGRPQMLLLAGDAIYADATYGIFDPTLGTERYDQRYFEAWTAPHAREVLRRLPVYPMLDDHEVDENFEDGRRLPEQAAAGLRAFEHFQLRLTSAFPDPRAPMPRRNRYWYSMQPAGFDFFVADTRADRRRLGGGDSDAGSIIRERQMRALQEWLLAADPAKPKFIVSPSVVAPWQRETRGHPFYSLRSDAWDGFPASLCRLLTFIAGRQIRNVVFLSGDFHCSLFCEMELALAGQSAVPAYSIVSSGLYAPYPFANTRFGDLEERFEGPYKRWLGDESAAAPGELTVRYAATCTGDQDSFAILSVAPEGAGWNLSAEFDFAAGTTPPRSVQLR